MGARGCSASDGTIVRLPLVGIEASRVPSAFKHIFSISVDQTGLLIEESEKAEPNPR
jgi:hypothetical protein